MATCNDYITVVLTGWLYALTFFFRASIAPITDVLEAEFNATSSEIGLMSSLFWLSYFIAQIPLGMLLQKTNTEFILIVTSFLFSITSFLFGMIRSTSIILPGLFMLLSGILASPMFLCFASLVSKRFSNNHLALYGGIIYALNSMVLVIGNVLQAFLYQNYSIWRPIYWVISAMTFIVSILMMLFNCKHIVFGQSNRGIIDYAEYSEQEMDQFTDKKPLMLTSMKLSYGEYKNPNVDIAVSTMNKLKCVLSQSLNWVLAIHQFGNNTIQFVCFLIFFSFFFFGDFFFHRFAFNGLWLINYMRLKYGINRQISTMISNSFWLSYAIGNVAIGKLSNKFKKRKIFYFLTMFILFIPPSIIVYGDEQMPLFFIILCNILSGVGTGIGAVTFVVVREYNDYYKSSDIASGFINSVSISAGFIMQYLIGILMDYNWQSRNGQIDDSDGGRAYSVEDYNFGFVVLPIIGAIGIFLSFLVKETNGMAVDYTKRV